MALTKPMSTDPIIQATKNWVERFVIKLNLCPFAKAEIKNNRVRFKLSNAATEVALLQQLQDELNHLNSHQGIETTLLIHPNVLSEFHAYNDFLEHCDDLLDDMQLDGIYQIASFHPQYQFADTHIDDAENYSNRSPYPMLHILREKSLEAAISRYPNVDNIPLTNIKTLNKLGASECASRLKHCFENT